MILYLNTVRKHISNGDAKAAIDCLETYCNNTINDTEAAFWLAFLFVNTQVYTDGFLSSINLLKNSLRVDPFDVKSLLLLSYIESWYTGGMEEDSNKLLESYLVSKEKNNYKKHLLLLNADYYFELDKTIYVSLLRKSIKEDPTAAYNYIYLGRELADKEMFQKGINNIKTIVTPTSSETYDPLNFDSFIDENVRGVSMTSVNYDSLIVEMNSM
ncbi:MAG: hypothetical protein JO154_20975 [Chitinophaga sp.]|uniref:tetratricopeptide repeat protein n=1 Tax=Chitinophaga sp. TaxID=1869181 RepID=UPI0025BB42A4|nr:hypothetical protein [Chitinophaga sp.]MBV8255088.1 hypothetical protein [Chitinophaga sp.]